MPACLAIRSTVTVFPASVGGHVQPEFLHLKAVRGIDRDDVQVHPLAKSNFDAFGREGVSRERDVDGSDRIRCVRLRADKGKRQEKHASNEARRSRDEGGRRCVPCHVASVRGGGIGDHPQRPHITRTPFVRTR